MISLDVKIKYGYFLLFDYHQTTYYYNQHDRPWYCHEVNAERIKPFTYIFRGTSTSGELVYKVSKIESHVWRVEQALDPTCEIFSPVSDIRVEKSHPEVSVFLRIAWVVFSCLQFVSYLYGVYTLVPSLFRRSFYLSETIFTKERLKVFLPFAGLKISEFLRGYLFRRMEGQFKKNINLSLNVINKAVRDDPHPFGIFNV